jgi:hypothetical protein
MTAPGRAAGDDGLRPGRYIVAGAAAYRIESVGATVAVTVRAGSRAMRGWRITWDRGYVAAMLRYDGVHLSDAPPPTDIAERRQADLLPSKEVE